MSEGVNKVLLIGHLGADPELRYTTSGAAVLNMRVATTERYKDSSGDLKERTDWHSVVVWGKRAEALAKLLAKGSHVYIEGSLRTSSYEARDGSGKRYRTEVNAVRVTVLNGVNRDREQHDGDGPRAAQRSLEIGPQAYQDEDLGW